MADDSTSTVSRRTALKALGTSGAVALAGCLGGGGSGGEQTDSGGGGNGSGGGANSSGGGGGESDSGGGGGSGGEQPNYPHTIWGMYGSWEDAYVQGGKFFARDKGFEFENYNSRGEGQEQISQIQSFVQQGADGIAVGPVSATAPASAIENAASQDIPVISCNSDIETPDLSMSIYIGNEPATQAVGEAIVKQLRSDGSGNSAEGTVLDLQGDLAQSIGASREQGFRNAVNGVSGIEVLETRANFNQGPAQEGTFAQLQSTGGNIDAIFAANGAMAAGAAEALDRYGSQPGDVFMGCMDGSPTVIDLFDEGWLQRGYAQPTQYYLPIALHYLDLLRTEGEGALPSPGDELTTDDLNISGQQHLGTDIWSGQDWAPATVREKNGHPWFQTSGKLLNSDNYDQSSNWGVIFSQDAV
jgi:ABC-type sugar transport system substrate-binding protein